MTAVSETLIFLKVWDTIEEAKLIAWDGCHKIYLALDDAEANWFREHYEITFLGESEQMMEKIADWWDRSCGLRFISGVSRINLESQFVTVIGQFEDEEMEEDSDTFDEQEEQ